MIYIKYVGLVLNFLSWFVELNFLSWFVELNFLSWPCVQLFIFPRFNISKGLL